MASPSLISNCLDFLGEPEKAVESWRKAAFNEQQLQELDADVLRAIQSQLWTHIAQLCARQGHDGTGVTRENNTVTYHQG
jgi:hypothetical protein